MHNNQEPKFNVDGSVYSGPWGRPQNDGPAIRASTLSQFAQTLNIQKKIQKLYRAEFPATSPIKRDLEYVAKEWAKKCFDIWEEIQGEHFYTLVQSYSALKIGGEIAKLMKDDGAIEWYD